MRGADSPGTEEEEKASSDLEDGSPRDERPQRAPARLPMSRRRKIVIFMAEAFAFVFICSAILYNESERDDVVLELVLLSFGCFAVSVIAWMWKRGRTRIDE